MLDQKERRRTAPVPTEEILDDYLLAYRSRQASLIGRREVMSGKAKFGIFGDGKELAQIALAKVFRKGDFRSGYYRDQTFMFATGAATIAEFFAQLYAHADVEADPASAGRQMNAHFASRSLNPDGSWKDLMQMVNTAADVSCTASQMPRLVGLGYASKLFRELRALHPFDQFSHNGNEIAFGTIGNASCAEGMFWEAINAIGVLKVPVVVSIWDDDYGISVPNEYQITKQNLSELLEGFRREPGTREGFDLYTVRGWDYLSLVRTCFKAAETTRKDHVPAIIHVTELTQPQGHSTSGSHERYKSVERLGWEREYDCLAQMRGWMLDQGLISEMALEEMETGARQEVEAIRAQAWEAFQAPIRAEIKEMLALVDALPAGEALAAKLAPVKRRLVSHQSPIRQDVAVAAREILMLLKDTPLPGKDALIAWKRAYAARGDRLYASHLHSESPQAARLVKPVPPVYSEKSPLVQGYQIVNACFDAMLARDPRVIAFGEDVGRLGDVNQGFAGLQEKYGRLRVTDTGIREATIMGQAIGAALRGLRPIAEIQYLDYLLYALQILSDDLATLHWRTRGGQKAPVIVRTRGHRLEGIWHSGSPMAGIIHLLRGMHVLVPRNMTQAAGFYNTLLRSDEPGLVVEVLNGYRLKERLPANIGEFTLPLGVPEVLRAGDDITVVTYGAMCRIALEAAGLLHQAGIEAEVVDVQALLPFDVEGQIGQSLQKTNRVLFLDEDVPGGTTAYMMQEVIEKQGGFFHLDSEPHTLSAKPHRPAYGSDGNYWSKPNVESVLEKVYMIMHETDPRRYPVFF